MRVAISGTHCCGKSTLIDELLRGHPEYNHEREPYAVFEEDYGEMLAAEPSAEDFHRQLEFMVERLETYRPGDRVIFERSPVDFLAYMLALDDLGRSGSDSRLIEVSLSEVRDAVQLLDLIVFLPLDERSVVAEEEDPELRSAVNTRLVGIFGERDFNLFGSERPALLEVFGSTAQRLRTLEAALKEDIGEV
jgi:hypothetical protein